MEFLPFDTQPCTVFDPFVGSGTTLLVANSHGRRGIGMDLSRDYLLMAADRCSKPRQPRKPARRRRRLPQQRALFELTEAT